MCMTLKHPGRTCESGASLTYPAGGVGNRGLGLAPGATSFTGSIFEMQKEDYELAFLLLLVHLYSCWIKWDDPVLNK